MYNIHGFLLGSGNIYVPKYANFGFCFGNIARFSMRPSELVPGQWFEFSAKYNAKKKVYEINYIKSGFNPKEKEFPKIETAETELGTAVNFLCSVFNLSSTC